MSAATITERSTIGRSHPLNRCLSPRLIACATPRARSRIALSGLRLTPRRRLLARAVDHVAGVEDRGPALRLLAVFMEVATTV